MTYHGSTEVTSFKTVYGSKLPPLLQLFKKESKIDKVMISYNSILAMVVHELSLQVQPIKQIGVFLSNRFNFGMIIQNHALQVGFQGIIHVVNELIGINKGRRRIDHYYKMLDKMQVRHHLSWNSIVLGFALNYDYDGTIEKFWRLGFEGLESNSITFYLFLNASLCSFLLGLGRQLHGFMLRWRFDRIVSMCDGLVDFLVREKMLVWQRCFLMKFMKKKNIPDVVIGLSCCFVIALLGLLCFCLSC